MNWGYKILTVYSIFVCGIVWMVYQSSTQKIDLVTPDYYAKELKFQDRIDAIKRTALLSEKVRYEIKENKLLIKLPVEFDSKEINGNVMLYQPADNSKDIKKDFTTSTRAASIEMPSTAKGYYQLQINWVADGHAYYFEENVFL